VGDYTLRPSVQLGAAETPELANLDGRNLATASHSLKSFGMNFEQFGSLVAIEQGLKLVLAAIIIMARFDGLRGVLDIRHSE
jgi:hypothetical protein